MILPFMQSVELSHRFLGGDEEHPPIVLLHGLLGSARNWQSAGGMLTPAFRVFVPDLRNHGESPHNAVMDYPSMASDLLAWMDNQSLSRIHLVGHSMGGKVAMYLACRYPERVASLTVVDISPRQYPPRWEKEFAVMQRMPVAQFTKRQEAEAWLEEDISDWAFRKFLVSNLERDPAGGFQWVVNLDILQAALPNLFQQIPEDGWRFDGPVLFLRGSRSRFIEESDESMIRRFFPFATLRTIDDAGHNVHFDQPADFVEALYEHIEHA
jgi:esterase